MQHQEHPTTPRASADVEPARIVSDKAIATQLKLALHATMAAQYFRLEATKTRSRRWKAQLLASAVIEDARAWRAWEKFRRSPVLELHGVISEKGRVVIRQRALQVGG
jgi:hypothetical protein